MHANAELHRSIAHDTELRRIRAAASEGSFAEARRRRQPVKAILRWLPSHGGHVADTPQRQSA
jgi:hypothetical protein